MALKPAVDMPNSESVQGAAHAALSRIRLLFWTIGPALGLLQVLALRNRIDHDAVAYLDKAGGFLHGAHGALLNAYWSPLYPFLLAHAIVFASPYWQATALHLVNFAIYLLVLLSFDFFLKEILPQASESAAPDALPERILRAFAYALVLWCCLIFTSLGQSHPDLLVIAAVFVLPPRWRKMQIGRGSSLLRFCGLRAARSRLSRNPLRARRNSNDLHRTRRMANHGIGNASHQ